MPQSILGPFWGTHPPLLYTRSVNAHKTSFKMVKVGSCVRASVVKRATWAKRFFTCECAERNELVTAVAGGRWYSVGRLLVVFSEMDCE